MKWKYLGLSLLCHLKLNSKKISCPNNTCKIDLTVYTKSAASTHLSSERKIKKKKILACYAEIDIYSMSARPCAFISTLRSNATKSSLRVRLVMRWPVNLPMGTSEVT